MSRRDVLTHHGKYIYRREDFQGICDGDDCAAQILDLMEYWTGCKFDEIKRVRNYNKSAAKFNQSLLPEPTLWLYERIEDFQNGLMNGYKRSYIIQRLKTLKEKGFIRDNPSPNPFDKTKMYALNIEATQSALDKWWENHKNAETIEESDSPKITLDSPKINLDGTNLTLDSLKTDSDLIYGINQDLNSLNNSQREPKPPNPVSDIPHPDLSFSEEDSLIPDGIFAKIANQCEQLEAQHINTQTNTTASLTDKKQRSTQITKNPALDKEDCAATFFSEEDKVITPPKENACLKAEQNFVARSQGLPEYRSNRGPNGVKPDCLDAIAKYLSDTPHYLDRKVKANRANAKNFIYKHEGDGKQDLIVDLYQEYRVKPKIESQEQPSTPPQVTNYDDVEDNLYNLPKVWRKK